MLGENVRSALEMIGAHRLRSALNVLGIVVAVSSVILIVSLGRAAERQITQSLDALGSRMLLVYPTLERADAGGVAPTVLTQRDATALRRSVADVTRVVPQLSTRARLVAGRNRADTSLRGTDQEFFAMTPLEFVEGAPFDAEDVRSRALVIVVGRTVADRLFRDQPAVGQRVRVNGVPVRIAGVAAMRGGGFAGDQNDFVLMPITTMRQRFGGGMGGGDAVGLLLVQFSDQIEAETARERVVAFFQRQKNVSANEPNPISVTSSEELSRATSTVIGVVQGVLAAIASISLVVGGIGIANIMLVSVAERTREIGLRMALGAEPRHIRSQFLTEAAILCLIGGLLGILVAGLLLGLVRLASGFPVTLTVQGTLIVLALSAGVGLVAGYVPAKRAAALDPTEALRRE